jgi:hypothetical protein
MIITDDKRAKDKHTWSYGLNRLIRKKGDGFHERRKGRLAHIEKISINDKLFPDFSACKLLATLKV